MTVVLLVPPFLDPRQPYLAVPSLSAYLRKKGHQTIQMDLNVRCFNDLLSPDHLLKLFRGRSNRLLGHICRNVPNALDNMRQRRGFFDIEKYVWSRNILELALHSISTCYSNLGFSHFNSSVKPAPLDTIVAAVLEDEPTPYSTLFRDRYVPEIAARNPCLAGISVSNASQLVPGLILSMFIKRLAIPVILGGPLVTSLRNQIRRTEDFFRLADGVVLFEGEEAILRAVQNLGNGKELFAGINNCICRNGHGIIMNNRPFSLDLDTLPTPDFQGFELSSYLAPDPVLPLLSSKGCSWGRCTFCSIPDTSCSGNIRSRERSMEKVVDDLAVLSARFKAKHFFFVDENIPPNRLSLLSEAVIRSRLNVRWIAYTRFSGSLDLDLCKLIYKSGCRKLLMGLESASPRILKLIQKGISLSTVDKVLGALDAANIRAGIFAIAGFPDETLEEMHQTFKFIIDRRDMLFHNGFSCSFSPFNQRPPEETKTWPVDSWVDRSSDAKQKPHDQIDEHLQTGTKNNPGEMAHFFNARIRDAMHPLLNMGWEEDSLLYIDNGAGCRIRSSPPTREMKRLFGDETANELVFRQRNFLVCENAGPSQTVDIWLFNIESAKTIQVSWYLLCLLRSMDGRANISELIDKFSRRFGIEPSAFRDNFMQAIETLWRGGYVELARS